MEDSGWGRFPRASVLVALAVFFSGDCHAPQEGRKGLQRAGLPRPACSTPGRLGGRGGRRAPRSRGRSARPGRPLVAEAGTGQPPAAPGWLGRPGPAPPPDGLRGEAPRLAGRSRLSPQRTAGSPRGALASWKSFPGAC